MVLSQAKGLGEVVTATAEHATDGFENRLRRLLKEFDKQRTTVEAALEKGTTRKELLEPIRKFTKATSNLRRSTFDIKHDYMHPPARAFQAMLQEVQPTWGEF